MTTNNSMTTLSEVTNLLKERGYTKDFNLRQNHLECLGNHVKIFPGEFIVDKHYRFEGTSDPSDEAIVFAISSPKHDLKGVLINGYGVSSDSISDEMIMALDERKS
ncbi:MAG: phosphoribosylpyrophosphate synthetase [Gelidibacter sp.]